ncbi:MAG: hypothetical protein HOV83_34315 [Catenulispora sp.]|nr:hypothetical protein [Catenulispora sp.]
MALNAMAPAEATLTGTTLTATAAWETAEPTEPTVLMTPATLPSSSAAPAPSAERSTAAAPATAGPKAGPAGPSIHRRVLLTWVAVYPTITILQSLLGTKVAAYPLPVRTLVLTVFMAPLVTYLMLPAVMKAHAKVVARRRISG